MFDGGILINVVGQLKVCADSHPGEWSVALTHGVVRECSLTYARVSCLEKGRPESAPRACDYAVGWPRLISFPYHFHGPAWDLPPVGCRNIVLKINTVALLSMLSIQCFQHELLQNHFYCFTLLLYNCPQETHQYSCWIVKLKNLDKQLLMNCFFFLGGGHFTISSSIYTDQIIM